MIEKVAAIQNGLKTRLRQSERAKDAEPVLTSTEIGKRDGLIYYAIPILTKPKPKPPVIPPSTPGSGTQTPRSDAPKSETPGPESAPSAKEVNNGPSEMDID